MKAVVFHGLGDIRLDNVKEPKIKNDGDAIVRLTASAICGTDLHMVRGTMPGMKAGTILGHEGIGIVEEVGKEVTSFKPGDRVVIPSTINCGHCSYCNAGYTSQCDNANPNGPQAGTAFFGGPATTGPLDGLQAEFARVPLANASLVKLPEEIMDNQAILLSDIFPTGYFGADMAEIKPGDTVAVFGCGPVGLFTMASAKLMGAGRVFAVDHLPDRLAKAKELGAEPVNFDEVSPTLFFKEKTQGIGVLRRLTPSAWTPCSPGAARPMRSRNCTNPSSRRSRKKSPKRGPGQAGGADIGYRAMLPLKSFSGQCSAWPRPAPCRSSAFTRRR